VSLHRICALDDIVANTGVAALVAGEQVAVFRLDDDRVYAVGNRDPFSGTNVISRGIVGDLNGEVVVASPVYKQHFSLRSGVCLEDAAVKLPVYRIEIEAGHVCIEAAQARSTCCYCGVGCGLIVTTSGGAVLSVKGDPDHPANHGRLCTKGAALPLTMASDARLLYPELRTRRDAARERASWSEALDLAADRFSACIAKHGPDSVAFYVSGQLLTEDYYVFNKLAKGLIGTNNIDTNSRLCMSSAVAGYKLALGADAPPCCYEDIDAAEVILIAGSNTAYAHPVLFQRIERARAANPRLKIIVVDPRETLTARSADLHLAIRPGTDVVLFDAMLDVIVREGMMNRPFVDAHTEGFEALPRAWTPQSAAAVCDVPAEAIVRAAHMFARAAATLSLYCQGLNQSANGTMKNCALINLHLATGQIGRPGAGPFSLTGQPNAMGGREVGGMATLLSAHRDLASAAHREEVAKLWGVPSVPARPGKTAVEMFDALDRGEIKAIWIACTNPVHSMPDAHAARRALERAEFVVVQDAFVDAEICDYADVLLPAASWAEREGTATNSERGISRIRAALPAPGEARPDWQIAVDFAHRLGGEALFAYSKPEDIFNEHRESTRGRDLDITGLSYALLEERGPQQWPFPQGAKTGTRRLYEDGRFPTPSGRARFVVARYEPPVERPDADYPLLLMTGRLRDQWHTMTRTGQVSRLFGHSPVAEAVLHPVDLGRAALKSGDLARLASRRGACVLKVRGSEEVRPGEVFVPMHWGARFMSGPGVNVLTTPATDPHSRQPELKHAAVRVDRFDPAWGSGVLCAPASAELRRALAPLMQRFEYASLSLVGNELRLELAAARVPGNEDLRRLDALFGPEGKRVDARSRAVCACFEVSESDIRAAITTGLATLPALKRRLKCGTNCGSCVPEVKRLLAEARRSEEALGTGVAPS